MEEKRILYVDDREPPRLAELLAEQCPIPIEIKQLVTGDFLCEDVVFERKSQTDFVNSIFGREDSKGRRVEGRVFLQAERLSKFPHRFILVSGTFEEMIKKIHRHALVGALASLMVNGVNVCFGLGSDEDLIYLILKVLEKYGKLKMIPQKNKLERKPTDPFVGVVE